MYRHVNHAFTALFVLALLAAHPCQSAADGGEMHARNVSVQESEADSESTESETTDSIPAEMPLAEVKVETHTNGSVSAGYRALSFDRYAGRAAEYTDLHSSPTFGAMYSIMGKDHKFAVEGSYITDRDYHGDLTYDYMGAYRLHLRTESLFHNLDHQQLAAPASISLSDSDPAARYGIRVEQDLAAMRIRLGNNPLHLNLGYWRLYKKGTSQQIFADHAFNPVGAANAIYSKSSPVDSQTHEGKLGFDAHIGPLDLIYDFTIRQFTDHAGVNRAPFIDRADAALPFNRAAGSLEHNDALESRYLSHTVKLHTEQTGGIVAAASYSYGQRKNLSSLSDVSGVNGLSTTLQNAAGDFVYTPCKEFSLAVRFRHQEIDRDTASNLVYSPATPSLIPVLPAIDTTKDIVSTTLSIRPVDILTVKGEYRGEFTRRDNVDSWNRPGEVVSMSIPENTATHRGILTLLSRPVKGLRIKARYSYTTTDNPAYGTSADERHEGQLLAVYSVKDRWGVTANYQNSYEENNSKEIATLDLVNPSQSYSLPRERRSINATATVWGSIMQQLTLSGSAGLLRTKTDQDVLFAGTQTGSVAASNYTSQAVLYSINAAYRATEKLGLNLMFQQVRSNAEFDPAFLQYPVNNSTDGVKSISWLKTVENSVNFSADYALARNISCGVAYSYHSYNDDRSSAYDGSLHSVTGTLTAKW